MKPKRRNLTRWMEARLRRLDHKLDQISKGNPWSAVFLDVTPASIDRCHARRHELANLIQIAWANRTP